MNSHLVVLLVFSALVAVVFAVIHRDDTRARVLFGLRIFLLFVLSAVVVGWLMAPFPS